MYACCKDHVGFTHVVKRYLKCFNFNVSIETLCMLLIHDVRDFRLPARLK
jgi:hypothetical protein